MPAVVLQSKYKSSPQKPISAVNTDEIPCKKVSPTVTCTSEQQSHTCEVEGNSLLDGTYDEEESAASFQQALAEWRAQAGKTSTSNETQASLAIGMHKYYGYCKYLCVIIINNMPMSLYIVVW